MACTSAVTGRCSVQANLNLNRPPQTPPVVWSYGLSPTSPRAAELSSPFMTRKTVRQLSLSQSITDLYVVSEKPQGRSRTMANKFYVGDIFRQGKPLFLTLTAKAGLVSVYIDGTAATTPGRFPLSRQDFDGELVIATYPKVDDSWSGLLRGFAFYDQELSPAQVLRHFETWKGAGQPNVSTSEQAVALYLFNEHSGRVVRNQIRSGPDLYIPDRYIVLDQALFLPFWREFHLTGSYFKDVLVNIFGFVPCGFLFCAWFSITSRFKKPALATILIGFAISLTIESLQSFLPTRDSGTTDLFTNTLGTCIGVWLYRLKFWRVLGAKLWTNLARTALKASAGEG